jgi:putative flippase GtrA
MIERLSLGRLRTVFRFYQAAAVNAAFGFGCYFAFVAMGVNMFIAQILAHVIGVVFNHYTYSRHVFGESGPITGKFILSYLANYFVSLSLLAIASVWIKSPYFAGAVALVMTSIVNYFLLRRFVFVQSAVK